MRRLLSVLLLALFSVSTTSFLQTDNGCKPKFTGKARKLQLLAPNRNYPKFNDGNAISVKEFSVPCDTFAKIANSTNVEMRFGKRESN